MFGKIMMYHRIVNEPKNPYNTPYTVENSKSALIKFIENSLNEGKIFVTIPQLVEEQNPDNIVITIDDGYVDMGFDVFRRYNIPFHFFISNSFVNKKVRLWWYEIEDYIKEIKDCNQIEKETLFEQIRNDVIKDESILAQIPRRNYDNLLINWEQLRQLSSNPLCHIGCHSYKHRNLTKLNERDIIDELITSKKELECKLNINIDIFSFPYGAYNGLVLEIVKRYFNYAVITREDEYKLGDSKFLLPRRGGK